MLNIFKSKAKDVKNAPPIKQQILADLRQGMKTTHELRKKYTHQTLTSRLSELEAQGLIFKFNTVKKEGDKRPFTQWAVETDPAMVLIRKKHIEHDKYFAWVRLGQKKGYFQRFGGLTQEQADNEQ